MLFIKYLVPQGQKRVIGYASRRLRPSGWNMGKCSSMKLELASLKCAVTDKFRIYLLGSEFTIYTDNNPFTYLQTAKLGAVEQLWASQLASFMFTIVYRYESQVPYADAMSRLHHLTAEVVEILSQSTNATALPTVTTYQCERTTGPRKSRVENHSATNNGSNLPGSATMSFPSYSKPGFSGELMPGCKFSSTQ